MTARRIAPTALHEPGRLVADEGSRARRAAPPGPAGPGGARRVLRDPAAPRGVPRTRRGFRRHLAHPGAVTLVARPTTTDPSTY